MNTLHYNLLREYLDEIIVNQGVIRLPNPERIVDRVKVDYLVKLAFRFYRKLYSDEIRAPYMNTWEWFRCFNCPAQCPEFCSSVQDPERKHQTPAKCRQGFCDCAELVCFNCGKTYESHRPEDPDSLFMSLCDDCRASIGEEIEIWRRLFAR